MKRLVDLLHQGIACQSTHKHVPNSEMEEVGCYAPIHLAQAEAGPCHLRYQVGSSVVPLGMALSPALKHRA